MNHLLALLPILLLVAVSLTKGVKPAVLVGWAVTTGLFFYWGAGTAHYLGALAVSLLTTVNILLVVLGAIFLYTIMQHRGLIEQITHSLDQLHPSRELRFFLLALGLTAFFEGVAGFGTPGAIVPLILVALGFEAVLSVAVVLLFDGLCALFGAVGTPILTGLQLPLGLPSDQVQTIGITAAFLMSVVGLVVVWFSLRLVRKLHGEVKHPRQILLLYFFFVVPFCFFAWFAPELATVFGSLSMLVLSVLYLRKKGTTLHWQPWVPYAGLALLLLLPKLVEPLRQGLSWELAWEDLFGSGIRGSLKPLQSPFLPFVAVGLGVAVFYKSQRLYLSESFKKVGAVFVVLFPSVAIAQLMIFSGVVQPSMVSHIAGLLSRLGDVYPVVAPGIGVMGAFITGSTTISNLVFGPSQQQTALALGMDPASILALQLTGASLGNAICLFNIIAAASVANLKDYRAILSHTLVPTLVAALLAGVLGMVWLLV
ncbi:L-lactate permease [Rufibacter sediminis]|uniref:L-lactate permease n=1 Tax=Rufibacter sediminis TaxID=2762756 RepID=A0ABR6VSH2_9BACT|nr:L-lactate permease [Rufibacter sediminis]MBC3539842.1 L-lactate permease [Rufibacter sediminis]